MVLSFDEGLKFEDIKFAHKVELAKMAYELVVKEHELKMLRLEKMLEIAKVGSVNIDV